MIGTKISSYKITAKLGEGGMGVVWRATDGSKAEILCLEAGGTRIPITAEALAAGLHNKVVMHGREVFKEATKRMSTACLQALERAGSSLDEVAWLVPHQANLRIINAVGKRLGIDPAKVAINVQDYGNTGSASVPLALTQAIADGRIQPGDKVLLTSFGAGFHWGAVLLQY